MTLKATAAANANIAIIKYWGRRDDRLRIPTNDSISFTMDERLQSTTTVEWVPGAKADSLSLDGSPAKENERARVSAFLDIVRGMMGKPMHADVSSKNTFPRAAGLASSASGFAALAAAATKAAGIRMEGERLSALARLGSGSASRSVFGGAVEWLAGVRKDGKDCFAIQLSPAKRWKDLRNIIAITNPHEKRISSTDAMERTVRTSGMFKARLSSVKMRLDTVRDAIKRCDFESMAQTIMQESDSMHACMLDSWPPITYLNGASLEIMHRTLELNQSYGEPVAAYTFDAGPNAHIYTTSKHEDEVRKMLSGIDGIQDVLVCRVGEGVRYPRGHLF
jgi:diphosphomevalonate decarboxylase